MTAEKHPTSVYRYYDKHDLLLYVGITGRGAARNVEHNTSKDWWEFVTRQEVTHYPTRGAAAAEERNLIRKYRPPFNKQHNVDSESVRAAYLSFRAAGTESPASVARAQFPKSARIEMQPRPFGNVVLLTSRPEDLPLIQQVDLRDHIPITVVSGGRKAKVELITRNGAQLSIRVASRDASHICGAALMFRFGGGKNPAITIKRIELDYAMSRPSTVHADARGDA